VSARELFDLTGKTAIVTGGGSGIGRDMAQGLAEAGANIVLCARKVERCEQAAAELAELGVKTLAWRCDVRNPDEVQAAVQQTLERWGRLDILVANAGFGYRKPVVDGDIQRWKDMLDTNVFGLLQTLKYGVTPMLERGSGHVIVMSSVAGRVPTPGGGAYCGTKFAATASRCLPARKSSWISSASRS